MRWYAPLLYPFSLIYDGVTRFRNRLFDIGQKKSTEFLIPTIVVGNLNWGGTGKTPMIEFLINLLSKKYNLTTLSRGYGRKSKGFLMAHEAIGVKELGDEPYQLFTKFKKEIGVAVGEERILAIPEILVNRPLTELILLDDAFQHRFLKADYYILLSTFQKPFFSDMVIPLGTLREHRSGAKRADLIIVTKCPDNLSDQKKKEYLEQIFKYANPQCPVFFATLKYGDPYSVFGQQKRILNKAILVSGISDNSKFKEEVESRFELVDVLEYPDHHHYTSVHLHQIKSIWEKHQNAVIITTEKDAVKLKDPELGGYLGEIPIFALPVELCLAADERQYLFDQLSNIVQDKGYFREL